MGRLKELLTRTGESELIESEIYAVLIRAVRRKLVGTQLLARRIGPESIPGSSIDVDLETKNSMWVERTGEGAEFFKSHSKAETFNLKPEKFTLDVQITKEMLEDAKFALVEWQIDQAGYEMGEEMDYEILAQIKAGADANTVAHAVNSGTAVTVAKINDTIAFLEADDHHATDMVVDSGSATDLRNIDTFVEADKLGSRETFERGLIGRIMGMNVFMTQQAALRQTTYNYCLVVDREHALVMAEKRPISIARYDQVNKDITGIAVSARFKARYLRAEACAYLYST